MNSHITDLLNGDILDSLARAKFLEYHCVDCGTEQVIELKAANRFRNFVNMTYPYDQQAKAERTTKELKYRKNIF